MDESLLAEAKSVAQMLNWRVQATMPSVLAEGERFTLRLAMIGPDGLPAAAAGDLELCFNSDRCQGVEHLPPSVRFSPQTGGLVEISGLTAGGGDTAVITGTIAGQAVWANPAWIMKDPSRRLYWGDLHVHTKYSNCMPWSCKSPDFGYAFAQAVGHLDFAAAADHLRGIAAEPHRWDRLKALAAQYNLPGQFVAFLAFESSHKKDMGGDNNAYFLGDDAPYFWLDRPDMKGNGPAVPLEDLWKFMDSTGQNWMTIPHHSGRSGKYRCFDCDTYNPRGERLFEIYSAWGSSERRWTDFPLHAGASDKAAYFCDALAAGCRYGVICSSDDHTTMPGGESRNWGGPFAMQCISGYQHKGLAAIWATELNRPSLWEAMTSRRTYGTTFGRTIVDLHIGDLAMGQEAVVGRNDPLRRGREIRVRLSVPRQQAAKLVLVRNGQDIAQQAAPPAAVSEIVFRDEDNLDDIAVRGARFHPASFVSYYVRISGPGAQTQWTSPIWLDLE